MANGSSFHTFDFLGIRVVKAYHIAILVIPLKGRTCKQVGIETLARGSR